MTPNQYCRDKALKRGSGLYYSLLFLPPEKSDALTALFAFCRELGAVADNCQDPGVAARKLDWWREEIQHGFEGRPNHPLSQALTDVLAHYDLQEAYFQEIIDGVQMDLDYDAYPSFTELSLYCYRVGGVPELLAAEILGYEDRHSTKYANDLGLALQFTRILRDVRADARRAHVYIPLDELKRFGVEPAELHLPSATERTQALFAFQAKRARDYFHRAFTHLAPHDRYAQLNGLIRAALAQALLEELEAEGLRVLEHRLHLTPLRKLWIAWRTARRERKAHKRLIRETGGKRTKPE